MHYFDRLIPDLGYIFSQVYSYTFFTFLLILLSLELGFWVWGFQLIGVCGLCVAFLGYFVLYMFIEKQPWEKTLPDPEYVVLGVVRQITFQVGELCSQLKEEANHDG